MGECKKGIEIEGKRMVNDKKIAFIICTNNERWYNECVQYLSRLELPDGFDADVLQIVDAKSMASGYNEGMHASDAKYKIYLHHDVFIIRTDFIKRVILAFEEYPEVGIMGVWGTDKIVQDASYWNHWDCGKVYALDAMTPIKVCGPDDYSEGITSAKAVDGMILMTQYDVEWREDIFDGWDFYDVSQCFEFTRKGYKVAVFHENEISIMHDCGYSKLVNYNESRAKFCEEYAEFGFVYEKQEDKDKSAKEKDNSIKKFLDEINWLMSVDIDQAANLIGQVYSDTLRHNTIAILKIIFDIYAKEKAANRKCFFVNKGDTWEQLTEKYTEYKFLIRRVELEADSEALTVLYDALQYDKISLQAIGEIACHCCYDGTKVIHKLQGMGKRKMKKQVKNYYEIEEFQNMINTAEHVVNQIDRLRIDIKKKTNIKVEKNVLKAMGDSMVEIAKLLDMTSYYEEYNAFYSELQSGIYSSDICDKLMAWENDTKEWISKLSEAYGVCNICKKVVKYLPNHTHFQAEQRKHGFPYWNAVFESVSKKKRACPVCESMDRERMLSLMIDLLQPAEGEKLNVLQIAPSFAMDNWLKTKTYMNYETTDLMMPDVTFQADIQDMNMVEDGTYDIILCSHILEHVQDDTKAMKELYRVLKEDGVCLFLVPLAIGLDKTDEAFGLSAEENWRRFGQDDHARLYAREDFLDRLTDAGYLVHILGKEYFGEGCWQEQGLNDIHCIYAATQKDIGLGVEPYQKAELEEDLVSVVIPTYNRGYCIERAVNSVLNQTWKNLELIVVDDASTDDTESVIRGMKDSRIKYVRYEENRGANHARNVGIHNAKGNYIAFNDSDDEWVPEKLEKQMKQLLLADRTDGNVGCVYCVVTKYDKGEITQVAPDLSVLGESAIGDIYQFMQSHMFISTQTLLMKKEVFEEVGMFNEDLKRLQDWELLLRVAQKYKFTLVQESLVNAYIQEECISKNTKGWIDTVFYVIDKHNLVKMNKAAYCRLIKIGLNMMANSDLPEEYVSSVLKRISDDGILLQKENIQRQQWDDKDLIVSFCVSSYRRRDMLEELVKHLLSSPSQQFEVVIVDNCSNDGTLDGLRKLEDPRLKIYEKEKGEKPSLTWYDALDKGTGKWLFQLIDRDWIDISKMDILFQSLQELDEKNVGFAVAGERFSKEYPYKVYSEGIETLCEFAIRESHPTGQIIRKKDWEQLKDRKKYFADEKYGIYPHGYIYAMLGNYKKGAYLLFDICDKAHYNTRAVLTQSRFYKNKEDKKEWFWPENRYQLLILAIENIDLISDEKNIREFILSRYIRFFHAVTREWYKICHNDVVKKRYGREDLETNYLSLMQNGFDYIMLFREHLETQNYDWADEVFYQVLVETDKQLVNQLLEWTNGLRKES